MHKRSLFGAAFGLLLASTAPALALDNSPIGGGRCECFCDTGSGGAFTVYDSLGLSCGAFTNKTCNIEVGGVIRSGSLLGCWPEGSTGGAQSGGQGVRPGVVGPLNGATQGGSGGTALPGIVGPLQGVIQR